MCTYGNSVEELVEKMWETLDDIQGDFDRQTLKDACKKIAVGYTPVSDEIKSPKTRQQKRNKSRTP